MALSERTHACTKVSQTEKRKTPPITHMHAHMLALEPNGPAHLGDQTTTAPIDTSAGLLLQKQNQPYLSKYPLSLSSSASSSLDLSFYSLSTTLFLLSFYCLSTLSLPSSTGTAAPSPCIFPDPALPCLPRAHAQSTRRSSYQTQPRHAPRQGRARIGGSM